MNITNVMMMRKRYHLQEQEVLFLQEVERCGGKAKSCERIFEDGINRHVGVFILSNTP
jgi:hypothetical protein